MKEIKLSKGYVALVDDEDFLLVSGRRWQAHEGHGRVYAERRIVLTSGEKQFQSMHRLIMGASKTQQVDHRFGNGLDNRRYNLRLCSHAQNQWNRKKPISSRTSKFCGVCKDRERNNWRATIKLNGKYIAIGRYSNEKDAARAYDDAARKYHGEFARFNFPPEVQ